MTLQVKQGLLYLSTIILLLFASINVQAQYTVKLAKNNSFDVEVKLADMIKRSEPVAAGDQLYVGDTIEITIQDVTYSRSGLKRHYTRNYLVVPRKCFNSTYFKPLSKDITIIQKANGTISESSRRNLVIRFVCKKAGKVALKIPFDIIDKDKKASEAECRNDRVKEIRDPKGKITTWPTYNIIRSAKQIWEEDFKDRGTVGWCDYIQNYTPFKEHKPYLEVAQNLLKQSEAKTWHVIGKSKSKLTNYNDLWSMVKRLSESIDEADLKKQLDTEKFNKSYKNDKQAFDQTYNLCLKYINTFSPCTSYNAPHLDEAKKIKKIHRIYTISSKIPSPKRDITKPSPEKTAWDATNNSGNLQAYKDFILQFSDGAYSEMAKDSIERLTPIAVAYEEMPGDSIRMYVFYVKNPSAKYIGTRANLDLDLSHLSDEEIPYLVYKYTAGDTFPILIKDEWGKDTTIYLNNQLTARVEEDSVNFLLYVSRGVPPFRFEWLGEFDGVTTVVWDTIIRDSVNVLSKASLLDEIAKNPDYCELGQIELSARIWEKGSKKPMDIINSFTTVDTSYCKSRNWGAIIFALGAFILTGGITWFVLFMKRRDSKRSKTIFDNE